MNEHIHHHHDHGNISTPYGRAFAIGISLNILFVLAEVGYGIRGHSLALLADAGHNTSDVLGLAMAWGATLLSRRPASDRFTYGLQSASIFAALANALLLLLAVGGIGWEAIQRLYSPEMPATGTVMAVAAAGVAVNGLTAWLFHAGHDHDLNIRAAFIHMAGDALISLGVVITGAIIMSTGWLWLDPVAGIAIVFFIVQSTWGLLKGSTRLALQAVPEHIDPSKVKQFLGALDGVAEVHDLHIWAMSTTDAALSAHLLMPAGHPGDSFIHDTAKALEDHFHIPHTTLQIEVGDGKAVCASDCGHVH